MMYKIDLIFIDSGGGHRAAAAALSEVIGWQQRPWDLRLLNIQDLLKRAGDACDHYNRYPEDIRILAGLGLNTYRFSIEWARIEPEAGSFATAELDHYRRMLAACHENRVTPMVTFYPFTSPRLFAAMGGWGYDT